MNQEKKTNTEKTKMRRFGTYIILLLIGFLLGFVPMWWKLDHCSASLSSSLNQLHLTQLQLAVSTAVIDAKRGDYEPARLAISDFFTTLRVEIDRDEGSFLTSSQRESMALLFSKRDEIVTLLARSDTASDEQLSNLYISFGKVMGKKQS